MTLALVMLWACKNGPTPAEATDTGVEACGSADWWGTGQPLMLSYCAGCHSSHITGSARYGAPESVNLDTLADAQQWSERIAARVLTEGDMPPGGGMSDTEKEQLKYTSATWATIPSSAAHRIVVQSQAPSLSAAARRPDSPRPDRPPADPSAK